MDRSDRARELERLYRQAFAEYGPVALWNLAPADHPTPGAALAITPDMDFTVWGVVRHVVHSL